ncbi:MAG: ATP-binding protein [Saprospiraceae bacterium]|jgi:signal transduction histidine kinase|nr:ATP-binding protein [Saprospiraceae bacterium]
MKNIPKTPELLQQLQASEILADIPSSTLEWLIKKSEYCLFEAGEYIFEPDNAITHMLILVKGEYSVKINRGGKWKELGVWRSGNITGLLPFSRMKSSKGFGQAISDCYFLRLHKDFFVEMVNISYELTQALVSVMTSRVRNFTQLRFQDEKLMALGKLSAGLAHELNNPASAMVRSSEELYKRIHTSPEKFKSVITMRITPDQTDQVNEILFSKISKGNDLDLSLMEREERLDDLSDWLEDYDIDNSEDIAETLVDFDFKEEDLERIKEIAENKHIDSLLRWIESTLSLEKLVEEIQEASNRISSLIGSVKSYSHMDRAAIMEAIDIHEGIKSTGMMLKHEFKKKNIQVSKDFKYDLPKVNAYAGELNQVWTNLIVNAIDAMEQNGHLHFKSYADRHFVCVEITDNGTGIPEDIQTRIFEPFFTTKGMGEGTGMGLDIVKKIIERHDADITLDSKPGKTTFKLCFPSA